MKSIWLIFIALIGSALHAQVPNIVSNETSLYTTQQTSTGLYAGNNNDQVSFKNLLTPVNPSFLPSQVQYIDNVASGTASGYTSTAQYGSMPANYQVGWQAVVRCAPGSSGNVGSTCSGGAEYNCTRTIASQTAPGGGSGPIYTWSSTCPAALTSNDAIIISSPATRTAPIGELANDWFFGGSATCVTDGTTANLPPAPASPLTRVPQYLQCSIPAGGTATVTTYLGQSPLACNALSLAGAYSMGASASVQSGTGLSLAMYVHRLSTTGTTPVNGSVAISGTWANYSVGSQSYTSDTPTSACVANNIGPVQVIYTISNSGGTTAVVGLSATFLNELADTNPSPFRDVVVSQMKALKGRGPRFNVNPGEGASFLSAITPLAYRPPVSTNMNTLGSADPGTTGSIPDQLAYCVAVGSTVCDLGIPSTWNATDLANLADYLGGSSSTTWGQYRITSTGSSATWISKFTTLNIEFGNETWNSSFAGTYWQPFTSYLVVAAQACAALEANPSYNRSVEKCVASVPAYQGSQNYTWLTAADPTFAIDKKASNGYSQVDLSTNCTSYTRDILNEPYIQTHLSSLPLYQSLNTASTHWKQYEYEAALALLGSNNGCTQSQINGTVNGLASGLAIGLWVAWQQSTFPGAMTDYNFWELSQQYTSVYSGGLTADIWGVYPYLDGPTSNLRPAGVMLAAMNPVWATGHGIPVTVTNSPTVNQPAENNLPAYSNLPTIQAFKYTDGAGNYALVVWNTGASSQAVTWIGDPHPPTGTVTVKRVYSTSGNLTDTNEAVNTTPTIVAVSEAPLTNPSGDTMPAYSAGIYSYSTAAAPVVIGPGVTLNCVVVK